MTNLSNINLANYKSARLSNGLTLLTIQSNQKKSGVSMAVKAGNYQDPNEHLGLAHFLEHMLFLGTESHPEQGFHTYIDGQGGKCNAWTSLEYSNFFYDIAPHLLAESLARFSELFTSPLFAQKWIEKEINALDSEFQLKINDDIRRLHEVHKETSNPEHPFSRFTSGNKTTLNADPDILQQALFDFFKQNYVGENMCLVIVSPHDCNEVLELASELFSQINPAKRTQETQHPNLYLPEQLGVLIKVGVNKVKNRLILTFPLPSEDKQSLAKSLTYLSCIFGQEGAGSLLSGLKQLHFATALTAGGGLDNGTSQDFNISIQLTDLGIQHLKDVCAELFGFINFIKSQDYRSYLYAEKKQLAELAYLYQEKAKAVDLANQLSLKLHYYEVEDALVADYAMTGMDLNWLEKAYQCLTPDLVRMAVLSPKAQFEHVSEHYQVPYSIHSLSLQDKQDWMQAGTKASYYLPEPNPYLPGKLSNCEQSHYFDSKPQKIVNEKSARIWFKQDRRANAPHGHIYISLDLPNSQGNRKKIAMTRLFIEMFMDNIAEENYPALAAGLHYQISPHQAGMTIHISGYAEKQAQFATRLVSQLRLRRYTEQNFNNIKQSTLYSWQQNSHIKPANQLFKQLTFMIQNNQYAYPDLAAAIEDISFSEFAEFSVHLFDRVNLEAYITGNWDITQALPLADEISKTLFSRSKPCNEVIRRVYKLNQTSQLFHMQTPHQGVCVVNYYQGNDINELSVAQYMLLTELLSPVSFQVLRSEKQLGYLVGCAYFPINRCPGLVIYVQSTTHTVDEIQSHIDQMLADMPEYLAQLEEDDWHNIKQALIYHLTEKQSSLATSAQNDWISIGLKDTEFRRQKMTCQWIEQMQLSEIKDLVETILSSPQQSKRLILSAAPEGAEGLISQSVQSSVEIIKEFQSTAQQIEL